MSQNIIALVVLIGSPILGIYIWVISSRGENGERWAKRRLQGPFVPLSKEEIEDDARHSNEIRNQISKVKAQKNQG